MKFTHDGVDYVVPENVVKPYDAEAFLLPDGTLLLPRWSETLPLRLEGVAVGTAEQLPHGFVVLGATVAPTSDQIRRAIAGLEETIRRNEIEFSCTSDPARHAEIAEDDAECRKTLAFRRAALAEAEETERLEALPDAELGVEWEAARERVHLAMRDPDVGPEEFERVNAREFQLAAMVRRRHGVMGG